MGISKRTSIKEDETKTSKVRGKKTKKLDISMKGVVDNIVFSKKDVYAYYKISSLPYDFVSADTKISLAQDTGKALSALALNIDEEVDVHLIITHVPIDIDSWRAQVEFHAEQWGAGPNFHNFLEEQVQFLENENYTKKTSYIGVKIGTRGALDIPNVIEAGLAEAKNTFVDFIDNILSPAGDKISQDEERTMRRREEDHYLVMSSGAFRAERATAEDILLLLKRQLYPAMPTPYLLSDVENRVGPGDLISETGAHIEKKWNHLKITQMIDELEMTGYRASMVYEKFPRSYEFPNFPPFLYYSAMIGAAFTSYGRFTIIPASKMKKEVEKKRKQQKDEIINIEAGQDRHDMQMGGMPSDTDQAIHDMQILSETLAADSSPWMKGTFRIAVEAETIAQLNKFCANLKSAYDRFGIVLRRSGADQVDAFLEQMPGDRIRSEIFSQICSLSLASTSGFNFNSTVGDPIMGQ